MPVSGHEEPGVKPLARHSSDSVAGVPIKKRRFPFIQPPSPPSQKRSSSPEEFDVPEKAQPKCKEESSPSYPSGSRAVSGVAGSEKGYSVENNGEISADGNVRLVQRDIKSPSLDMGEPNLKIAPGSLDEIDCKGKLVLGHEYAFSITPQRTELKLAPSEALAPQTDAVINSKQKPKIEDKCEFSGTQSDKSLVASKEPSVPTSNFQNSEKGCCVEQETLDPCRWNLLLSRERTNVHIKGKDAELKPKDTHLRSNRSHWDLNTTMDSWEGSMNEEATANKAAVVNGQDLVYDVKPVISSTSVVKKELESTGVSSANLIFDKSEGGSKVPSFCTSPGQQYKSDHPFLLQLTQSYLQPSVNQEDSSLSTKIDLGSVKSRVSFSPALVSPSRNLDTVGCKTIKSEPFVDGSNYKSSPLKLVDHRTIKSEQFAGHGHESPNLSSMSSKKLVDHGASKYESVQGGEERNLNLADGLSYTSLPLTSAAEAPVVGKMECALDDQACNKALPIAGKMSFSNQCFTRGTMSCISEESSGRSEIFTSSKEFHADEAPQKVCEVIERSMSVKLSESSCKGKESKVTGGVIDSRITDVLAGEHLDSSRLNLKDEHHIDSNRNCDEGAESDAEKINLSTDMLEEDSYSSDYESDGNHAAGALTDKESKQHGGEDDDYEDGEVREPLVHAVVGGSVCKDIQEQLVNPEKFDNQNTNLSGSCGDDQFALSSHINGSDSIAGFDETSNPLCGKECDIILSSEKNDLAMNKDVPEQPLPVTEPPPTGPGKTKTIKTVLKKPLDSSGVEGGTKVHETEPSSDPTVKAREGTVEVVCQDKQENGKGTDRPSVSPKVEASVSGNDAIKDVIYKGSGSRIINLPRSSDGSLLNCARSNSSRSLPSQIEKERLTDIGLRGDKLHPRGSRDDSYNDGSRKLERTRNQDQPVRNSGMGFTHGRGKFDGRLDSRHSEWDSGRHFSAELHDGSTGFRFRRSKHTANTSPVRLECNSYVIAPDGTLVGAGMRGRKVINDELPSFHHPESRRRSPVGRVGPITHARMVRRTVRNISPGRCIVRDDPDLVGLRHEEKFSRNFPDEMMDHMFSHHQPHYERVENPFVRGERIFSPPLQRRGLPHVSRIRSRSPPRSRTRSPGPWLSPRRRSMDGFDEHPDLAHHRSPVIFREERMRSPHQRLCLRDDMMARRHGSPPYVSQLSNDMIEMGSGRDHDDPRSFMPHGSPSDMGLPRNRRFDLIDPRERTESDEYMGVPMHSGRFHELGERGVNERRKGNGRRGPVRPFRPPYNGTDVEEFHFHGEGGPRPFRFFPETDAGFHEPGSVREREFDRRLKNRPGNVPKRMRNTEEQEESFRRGGQVWHESDFNDDSRVNRRRF